MAERKSQIANHSCATILYLLAAANIFGTD